VLLETASQVLRGQVVVVANAYQNTPLLKLQYNFSYSKSDDDSVQLFTYLRAELNSQWIITESVRMQTTAIRQHRTKQ
jgi:hypothetical protein